MADQTDDIIAELMQTHVAETLRGYQGNLTHALWVVQNDWLPDENAPGVARHFATLRQYLTEEGRPESDSFLLRLGLTTPGTQRGIVPPMLVLDENRGGFPARRQREAAGTIGRLREALAIGRRFVPGLSDQTQPALAALADISQTQSAPADIDWFDRLSRLSAEQSERLSAHGVECLDNAEESVNEIGEQILRNLACFRDQPLGEAIHMALIALNVFWPSLLFRDGSAAVALRLISLIENATELHSRGHLLAALAWTRSAEAQQAFHRWTNQPPEWASEIPGPPQEYTHEAGWRLESDGQRHDLISEHCIRLVPANETDAGNLGCRIPTDQKCPSCEGPLSWLFDFTYIVGENFPDELIEAPRRVLCCLHCSCYGAVFTSYRPDGDVVWLSPNEPCDFPNEDYEDERIEPTFRRLDIAPFPAFACAEPFGLDDASTLGGIPMWLQNDEFPRCFECDRVMTFLAQHDNSPLGEEGIYYAFFCAECRVAAVSYQQT